MIVWCLTIFVLNIYLLLPVRAVTPPSEDVPPGGAPFMVSLQHNDFQDDRRDSHFCGGSIIDDQWILTAAHCMVDRDPEDFVAVVGSNDLNPGGIRLEISEIIIHPDYNPNVSNNRSDIAIIRTATQMIFNSMVNEISIEPSYILGGIKCKIFGWGCTIPFVSALLLRETCAIPNELQYANTTTMANSEPSCGTDENSQELCTNSDLLEPNLFFIGDDGSACMGDSGGPLAIYDPATNQYVQIGLVSMGPSGCFDSKLTGVSISTRTSSFRDWIYSIKNNAIRGRKSV